MAPNKPEGGGAYESGSALRKVGVLLLSQLLSRGLTFFLNVFTLRAVGVASFGVSSVNLLLLEATVLMLAREAIRRACPRFAPSCTSAGALSEGTHRTGPAAERRRRMLNVAWLSPALGVLAAAAVTPAFLSHRPAGLDGADDEYRRSLLLTAAASVLTLVGEPLYVLADCHVMFELRAKVEAAAVFARCAVTYALVVHFGGGLAAFAWAHMAYAAVFSGAYAVQMLRTVRANRAAVAASAATRPPHLDSASDLLPSCGAGGFSPELAWLAASFAGQSALKLVLTEGEKLVLMLFGAGADDSGVYGLVQNLGSLVARLLFLPLEESCFAEFSNLLGGGRDRRPGARAEAGRLLGTVVKLVSLVGLVFVAFGPSYSFVLFDVLYGAKWSGTDAPFVLSVYCVYILFIAVNGVTEAFITATIPQRDMRAYNAMLVAFSMVYLAGAAALVSYGPAGVIAANCANMLARVAYSARFARAYFAPDEASRLRSAALPRAATVAALALCSLLTRLSFRYHAVDECGTLSCYARHVAVGAACLAGFGAVFWRSERAFVAAVRDVWARRRSGARKAE